jgi:hypothetical protein
MVTIDLDPNIYICPHNLDRIACGVDVSAPSLPHPAALRARLAGLQRIFLWRIRRRVPMVVGGDGAT